jgi:hypothetical protein
VAVHVEIRERKGAAAATDDGGGLAVRPVMVVADGDVKRERERRGVCRIGNIIANSRELQ